MRLGVPFIALRQLGAIESNPGRQFLPSVAWRTGHCPVRISFLIWRSRSLAALEPLAHRTLSGAHRTVRCPSRPLARPRVPRGSVRCTPDSPMNYSRTPLIPSRERQVRLSQPGTPDTVRCTQTELTLADRAISFPIQSFLFPTLRHNTLVHKTMY
jgi:hypothetical protein